MLISTDILIRLIIAVLAFSGFWVSKHIHTEKKKSTPLVCPMNFNCHAVVHSDYSKFFGVPLEILGMIYYTFVTLSYVGLVFLPSILPVIFSTALLALSVGAFAFSIYLILVQLFILKEGCFWCFVSAGVSTVIFILSFFLYDLAQIFTHFLA